MLTVVHFSLLVASFHFLMTSTLLFCYKLDTTLVAISCLCYYWAHPLAASWPLRAVSANTNTNTNINSCLCYYWAHPLAASWPLRAARTQSFTQVAAQFAFGRRSGQFPRLGVLHFCGPSMLGLLFGELCKVLNCK